MARRKAAVAAGPVNTTDMVHVPVGKGGFLGHIVGHLAGKALPYLAPWAGAATLPPLAGFATNTMWGDAPLSAGLASAAIAVGGAALTTVAWKSTPAATKFGRFRRAQLSASVAAGMGWLTTATAAGPFGSPVLDAWLIGGGMFAASWNVRQIVRNGASGDVETEETGGGMAALAAAIGWEKVTVKSPKGTGKGTVKASIEVAPSSTIGEVQATAGKAAAALQLPPSGVVITKDPEDASKGTISLRVADLLKDGVPFAPPVAMGLLPTDDIPLGLYADGEVWAINPFAAAILQHLLIMGVTGAGKSELLRGLLAHLATRRKISVFLIDLAKGRQTVGHIADGIDWLIQEPKEAKRLLRALPAAIKARGDVLASEGLDQWAPASSLNAVVVWIEEAADVADFQELEETARKARSVGIWLCVSLQRATWTNLSTDIRANLQGTMCFGVNDAGDAGFCLPDRVTAAGAVPDWGSDRPGYAFSTGMGIPQERWTTEVRSGLTDRDELAALVAAGTPYRDPLDETTATALGQAYAQRAHKGTNRLTPGVAAAPAPVAATPATAPGHSGPAPTDSAHDIEDDEHMTATEHAAALEIQEAYDEVMGSIPADPEPDAPYASLDLDDDVPHADEDDEDGGMEFEAPAPVGTEEARHILYTELDGWVQTGRLEFEPADLIPATLAAQRKRPWMQGELRRLVELGLIQRDGHGSYSIVQSPLQPA
ncbi:FtsK/SpoIIIE domain-containing protein [Streptomyces sp. ADI98-10]|uniref:FtsK/SpoIIIE domain-containing protein n=1 Tax=Streptomyces sp. ADI98-10 TaxID=1522763 RepID=UPI000F5506B9|nr:FtsK/SpoIIIE domain-containing protein [Streptomyces sp. ADI98-10]RPK77825.1 DNA translocase SpoIIIE [Streptomyces sp. ADI98-10]